jgi:hypothetical protein
MWIPRQSLEDGLAFGSSAADVAETDATRKRTVQMTFGMSLPCKEDEASQLRYDGAKPIRRPGKEIEMKCDKCGCDHATYRVSERQSSGVFSEFHYCAACCKPLLPSLLPKTPPSRELIAQMAATARQFGMGDFSEEGLFEFFMREYEKRAGGAA